MNDSLTDFLWLADSLGLRRYDTFRENFLRILSNEKVPFGFLPRTRDIWAVDFMPVQVDREQFVQFRYLPDYICNIPSNLNTLTDVDAVCDEIGLVRKHSDILIDGGNLVRFGSKAIMCEKVFKENPNWERKRLTAEIQELLQLDTILFLPWDAKNDKVGHADGMVRFLDGNTVVVNDYRNEPDVFEAVVRPLQEAGLDCIPVMYNPYANRSLSDATGVYINFLQVGQKVFVPTFGMKEDDEALKMFSGLFRDVVPIRSETIAKEGGVLNCISWNIMKPSSVGGF